MDRVFLKKVIKIVLGVILLYILIENREIFKGQVDVEEVQRLVEHFGVWGILVFIGLGSVRPFLFIPSTLMFVFGGIIFGTLVGTLVSLIGILAGASICFLLASRFQGIFKKFVKGKYLVKLEELKERESINTLFIMRVTPAFPFDPISYAAGLAGITYYDFFLGTLLGSLPKVFLYTLLGDGIEDLFSYRTIGVFVVLILFALTPVVLRRHKGV